MMRLATFVLVVASGCLRAGLVDCDNGTACAPSSTCATFTIEQRPVCVPDRAFAACTGRVALDECELEGEMLARCYATDAGLACYPAGCGNQLIDPGEACDDGNALVGDGCSAGCRSDETCGNGIVDATLGDSAQGEQCDDGNLVGHDGCASDCTPETPRWAQIIENPNPGCSGCSLAYDATRERVVMFGGADNTTYELGDVGWEIRATPISPPSRRDAALVYDAARRRVLLFGGLSTSRLNDTWEWNGNAWRIAQPDSRPRARFAMGAAYDATTKRVLVVGGSDGVFELDEMWAWDGVKWLPVDQGTGAPDPTTLAGMALDPLRGTVVLAGGSLGSKPASSPTFEWDGHAWTAHAAPPPVLQGSALAFDGTGIIGVGDDNSTWRWDGTSWTRISSAPSLDDGRHALAYDVVRRRVIGVSSTGMTYVWNGTSWSTLPAAATPRPRRDMAVAFDSGRGRWVMFGGERFDGDPQGDTWELVGGRWISKVVLVPAPPPEAGAVMAYDARRAESVLFSLGRTWIWNGEQWIERVTPHVPPARRDSAMAYDAKRGRIVLFGGYSTTALDDTWEWMGTDWVEQHPTARPAARVDHVMAWDPIRERVVMGFGIGPMSALQNDLWEWDGMTWTRRSLATAPNARTATALAWNPARASIELFGGTPVLNDVWELGDRWEQRFLDAPVPARFGHRMLSSTDGTSALVFGGARPDLPINNQVTNELWSLSWNNLSTTYEACTSATIDADGDGRAGCADPDCWSRCAPECSPGAPCDATAPRCGDGVCSVLENCRLCPGDCGACTPACGDGVCDPGESCPGDC